MANTIKIKNSGTASNTPSAGVLEYGELALNYNDGKLFYKNASNAVVAFTLSSASSGGNANISVSDTAPVSPSANDLWYESDTGKLFIRYDSFWVEVSSTGATGESAQREARSDWQDPYSYIGIAAKGSSESTNVWKITRITVGTNTVTTASSSPVAWSNRANVTYS